MLQDNVNQSSFLGVGDTTSYVVAVNSPEYVGFSG
jgi:hypothetical protein